MTNRRIPHAGRPGAARLVSRTGLRRTGKTSGPPAAFISPATVSIRHAAFVGVRKTEAASSARPVSISRGVLTCTLASLPILVPCKRSFPLPCTVAFAASGGLLPPSHGLPELAPPKGCQLQDPQLFPDRPKRLQRPIQLFRGVRRRHNRPHPRLALGDGRETDSGGQHPLLEQLAGELMG